LSTNRITIFGGRVGVVAVAVARKRVVGNNIVVVHELIPLPKKPRARVTHKGCPASPLSLSLITPNKLIDKEGNEGRDKSSGPI
jgi:hypothetical protein